MDVNVTKGDIFKCHTTLCGTTSGTRKRIRQGAFQPNINIRFMLLLWSNPKWPPEWIVHVNFIIPKGQSNSQCEREGVSDPPEHQIEGKIRAHILRHFKLTQY